MTPFAASSHNSRQKQYSRGYSQILTLRLFKVWKTVQLVRTIKLDLIFLSEVLERVHLPRRLRGTSKHVTVSPEAASSSAEAAAAAAIAAILPPPLRILNARHISL